MEKYDVGIYSRLSVAHDDRKSESIENQIEIIRQYIIGQNKNPHRKQEFFICDTYIDRGISGVTFERAGFDRLMEDVRKQKINCVMVKDLSRLGRDYLETGNYIEKIFPFFGVRFISVADGFDSMSHDSPEKTLEMNIRNLVNDMYAKDIAKKVETARKVSAERGSYIGGASPYGYVLEEKGGIRTLTVHEASAAVVRYLFESYAAGRSYSEIIASLYRENVHSISGFQQYGHTHRRRGETLCQWNAGTIRGILSNPVYLGKLVQRRRKSGFLDGAGGSHNTGEGKWMTEENSHVPIIEQELFHRVNALLQKTQFQTAGKQKEKTPQAGDDENVFRHILYCAGCGRKMHSVYYERKPGKKRRYAYFCRNAYYLDERRCRKNYIKEEQLKNICTGQIKRRMEEQNLSFEELIDINHLEYEKIKNACRRELKQAAQERQRFAMQAPAMYLRYKEGDVNRQEYLVFREKRAEYDIFSEKRIVELEQKIKKSEQWEEEQNRFLRLLQNTGDGQKLTMQLADTLIERITVSPEGSVDIWFRFSDRGGEALDGA